MSGGIKAWTLGVLLLTAALAAQAQNTGLSPDQPPFALTLAQTKAWTPHGATAS